MRIRWLAALICSVLLASCHKPISTVPQQDPKVSPQPTDYPHISMYLQIATTSPGQQFAICCDANRSPFSWTIDDQEIASMKDLTPIEKIDGFNWFQGLRYRCQVTALKPGAIRLTAKSGSISAQALMACIDPSLEIKNIDVPRNYYLYSPDSQNGTEKKEILSDSSQWNDLWANRIKAWNLGQASASPTPTPPSVDFSKRSAVFAALTLFPHDVSPVLTHIENGNPSTISIVIPGIAVDGLLEPAICFDIIYIFEIPKISSDSVIIIQRI